jgi:light-regulated signal transduction histidine kinase (bacteriophytochrome)
VKIEFKGDSKAGAIVVRDNTVGMSELRCQYLFEFSNRRGRWAGTVLGAGLGLVIMRQLTEAASGHLRVDCELGAGSRFTITLPCARPAVAGHG